MEGSKVHQTLKRQKSSYMRVLYNGKHEHTPIMGGFCNQNIKTGVQSCTEIQGFYVRRWQCQGDKERQGNSAEGFEEGRLAAVRYQMFHTNQCSCSTKLTEG